jgi:glycerol kinase
VRAIIAGLSSHSNRHHIARAAFESISYQIRDALDAMRLEAGVPLGSLHADGGPTASQFLMQFTADIVGAKLKVATMPDCSPLGAVLVAREGMGWPLAVAAADNADAHDTEYAPVMSKEQADGLYLGWQAALRQAMAAVGSAKRAW